MKILDIKPFLCETLEDDIYAAPGKIPVSVEQITRLAYREISLSHEIKNTQTRLDYILSHNKPICYYMHDYPNGGYSGAVGDIRDGKLLPYLAIDSTWGVGKRKKWSVYKYVFQNTPEGQKLLNLALAKQQRVYQLMELRSQVHSKLVRDRRVIKSKE